MKSSETGAERAAAETGESKSAPARPPEERPRADGSAVGQNIRAANGRWSFGGGVPDTFEAHIERSVPRYREGHEVVAQLSDWFVYDGAVAVEIGASTGALTRLLAARHAGRRMRLVGLEIEPEMAEAAQREAHGLGDVEIREGDALEEEIGPADLIVSYYTIQFVRPALRQRLFDKIYASLNWGGAFIMFEKVRAPDARFQDIASALYDDFKLANGFSESEIISKRRSLKGVLEPFSTQANIDMMERAGFVDHMSVFKHLCFEGFLAIK